MRVRFVGLTPEALAGSSLTELSPVANFEVEDGGRATVLAGKVSPFRDVDFLLWPGRLREPLLLGLCEHVERAGWADEVARQLDLAGRFTVTPDRDEPAWRCLGFTWIQNVDIHVIKHVLGVGDKDPEAVSRWSRLFGVAIDKDRVLAELERLGCVAWKRLTEEPDPDAERPLSLYAGLSRSSRARCIQTLAPLRERYMMTAHDAMQSTSHMKQARHVHAGSESYTVMDFLDGRGIVVITKGGRAFQSVVSAFPILKGSAETLDPRLAKARLARVLRRLSALPDVRIHSPLTWGMNGGARPGDAS